MNFLLSFFTSVFIFYILYNLVITFLKMKFNYLKKKLCVFISVSNLVVN